LRAGQFVAGRASFRPAGAAQRRYLELGTLEAVDEFEPSYEYILPVPGEIRIAELGVTVRALTIAEDQARAATGSSLLSAALIGPELTVRIGVRETVSGRPIALAGKAEAAFRRKACPGRATPALADAAA